MGTGDSSMNPIVDQFNQILEFAQGYGLPEGKKKAILREYLQVKILQLLYREKVSFSCYFIGGTSLRLLYGLDRFSEDLDFDVTHGALTKMTELVEGITRRLESENIAAQLYTNVTPKRSYFELRFPKLLFELKLSANQEEKLTIKLDFEQFWQNHTTEVILLNRYGMLVSVVTISKDQLLVQKLHAYLHRAQTLPRDLYDIIWLLSHGAKPDSQFIKANGLSENLLTLTKTKFIKEQTQLPSLKRKLAPFLIDEQNSTKLDLFSQLLETL